jgi:hypothetical protein
MQDLLISLSPRHTPNYNVEWHNLRTRRKIWDDEINNIGNRPRPGRIMWRGNYVIAVLGNNETSTSTTTRVSAGALADVLSLLYTTTGVCGCARRRPLLPQHDDECLRVRPQTLYPSTTTGVCGCAGRRPLPPQHQVLPQASSPSTRTCLQPIHSSWASNRTPLTHQTATAALARSTAVWASFRVRGPERQ